MLENHCMYFSYFAAFGNMYKRMYLSLLNDFKPTETDYILMKFKLKACK